MYVEFYKILILKALHRIFLIYMGLAGANL
jgi:hypothetical protein